MYLNGKMTHAAMVKHLESNQGGLNVNGKVITRVQDLPPIEQWHSSEPEVIQGELSEIERLKKELREKEEKLLEVVTRINGNTPAPSAPPSPPAPPATSGKQKQA